jgi:hypothetical protein
MQANSGPMAPTNNPDDQTRALLARLITFCLPGGEAAARLVRGVRTTQRGEMRASPAARWIPFTANEVIESRRSSFNWEARMSSGGLKWFTITDAYEEGHGRLVVKLGGVMPVKQETGPDLDKGEIQRYLSSIVFCPPILINHASLEFSAAGPETLRVRDRADQTGATVDIDLGEDGRPMTCRAHRPRGTGKSTNLMPWFGRCTQFQEHEGLRIASQLEAAWDYPDGPFTYFRGEIASIELLRGE